MYVYIYIFIYFFFFLAYFPNIDTYNKIRGKSKKEKKRIEMFLMKRKIL